METTNTEGTQTQEEISSHPKSHFVASETEIQADSNNNFQEENSKGFAEFEQGTESPAPGTPSSSRSTRTKPKKAPELSEQEWYFGNIDRTAAETILTQCNEDTFLVRDSSKGKDYYALSFFKFKDQKISHTLIIPLEYGKKYYQLQDSARMYSSVVDLITKCPELSGYKGVQKLSAQKILEQLVLSDLASPRETPRQVTSVSHGTEDEESPSPSAPVSSSNDNNNNTNPVTTTTSEGGSKRTTLTLSFDKLSTSNMQAIDELVSRVLEDSNMQNVSRVKEALKGLIAEVAVKVSEYDKKLVQQSLASSRQVTLSPKENEEYLTLMQNFDKLKTYLYKLRLKGDEFRIIHKGETKLFKVTTEGQIIFCSIKRSTQPEDLVPEDMSEYAYFNVKVLDGREGSVYEITSSRTIHYIDQVKKAVSDSTIARDRKGGVCIFWLNGKKSTFLTAIPEDGTELLEVIGAHVKKYRQSSIKQIQLLKDIFRCKSTKFEIDIPEHELLLRRLWQVSMPGKKLDSLVSNQWKLIGFQGANPATDFRSMGLLGLLNLIYFAENYTEKVRKILTAQREYPWAVTGINITNMLLVMLNLTAELVNQPAPDNSWHTPLLTLFYYADNDDTFDELYSQSFLLFDKLWVAMKAGYMDFPQVIRRLQQLIEDLLKRKPLDVAQLIAWIEQLSIGLEDQLPLLSSPQSWSSQSFSSYNSFNKVTPMNPGQTSPKVGRTPHASMPSIPSPRGSNQEKRTSDLW